MSTKNYTKVELDFYFFIENTKLLGSFTRALFEAIAKADGDNTSKLALGFPEHVKVFNAYRNKPGFWNDLRNRINTK